MSCVDCSPLTAIYDLSYCPETFDFIEFLCAVKTYDKNVKIVFVEDTFHKKKKFKLEEGKERFESILLAACDLTGTEFRIVDGRKEFVPEGPFFPKIKTPMETYMHPVLDRAYRENGFIYKLHVTDEKNPHVCITLRNNNRNKYRNSNFEEWKKFEREISREHEVVVIDDYSIKPIPLKERMKIYESARLNLCISHGPSMLLACSESPYRIFRMEAGGGGATVDHLTKIGFPPGSQFLWRNENQECVWEQDKSETILEKFNEFIGKAS